MSDLGSITGLITAAGSVIGLANKVNTVEANQKIIELQQRLADVQQTFAELFQKTRYLKKIIENCRTRSMQSRYIPSVSLCGGRKVRTAMMGPFCPICFAKGKILMPLAFGHRATTPGLVTFECLEIHIPKGMGREPIYTIKQSSLKDGRILFPIETVLS
jgi:hypothetical protein